MVGEYTVCLPLAMQSVAHSVIMRVSVSFFICEMMVGFVVKSGARFIVADSKAGKGERRFPKFSIAATRHEMGAFRLLAFAGLWESRIFLTVYSEISRFCVLRR